MRTDPTKPTRVPGGIEWLKAGILDAENDPGNEYGEIPPRRSMAQFEGPR